MSQHRYEELMREPFSARLTNDDLELMLSYSYNTPAERQYVVPIIIGRLRDDVTAGSTDYRFLSLLKYEKDGDRDTLLGILRSQLDRLAATASEPLLWAAVALIADDRELLVDLEQAYVRCGHLQAADRVSRERLKYSPSTDEKIEVQLEAARRAERIDPDSAISRWSEVFELDPLNPEAIREIERLAAAANRLPKLMFIHERRAALLEASDPAAAIEALVRAADIAITDLKSEQYAGKFADRIAALRRR